MTGGFEKRWLRDECAELVEVEELARGVSLVERPTQESGETYRPEIVARKSGPSPGRRRRSCKRSVRRRRDGTLVVIKLVTRRAV